MPFRNLGALDDLELPVKTFTHRDPRLASNQPSEQYYEIRLRALDPDGWSRVWRLTDVMVKKYITGDTDAGVPPVPLLGYDGVPEEGTIQHACQVFGMQFSENEGDWQSFENIMLLPKRLPQTWYRILAFKGDLNREFERGVEKKLEAGPVDGPGEPSPTPINTPPSPGSMPAASTVSSNAPAPPSITTA